MRWSPPRTPGGGPLVAAALLLAVPALALAEPIAFVVAMKGGVQVTPAGAKDAQRAALGRPLERGDQVKVGAGGSASLFFSDGNVIELGERSTITVGGKVGKAENRMGPGGEVSADVFQKVSKFITSDSKNAGLVALAPMRSGAKSSAPFALAPRHTALTGGRPDFHWQSIEGANRYRVVLVHEGEDVWSREVEATELEYPADLPPLSEGDYAWRVQAFSDRGPLRDEEVPFRVLDPAEARQIDEHLESITLATGDAPAEAGHFVAGSYLMGRGLFRDAQAHFEALARLAPDSPGSHEALGNLYRAVGLNDLAAAEFQKALELTRTAATH
jgi:hypothetical protein